jgi:hypothetical protein
VIVHLIPVVVDLLSTARVRIVIFAPYSMQIFQVLGFALFGVFKNDRWDQLPFEHDTGSIRFITKVYRDFRSTMTGIKISGTFWAIDLISDIVAGAQRVSFDKMIQRENNGFREL